MAVYMIDYENVKTGGLNGISRLTEADRVIIFYSENANRLTFDLHQRLMASTAKIEYREVSVGGHNALDFQLVTYLGFLIAQDPNGQYLIISNDRGFEYVVNFWRKDGLSIGLLPYLKDPAYALQKAMRPDVRPVSAPADASEIESAPEPEIVVAAAEAFEPAETETSEPVSAEGLHPAEEAIFEESVPAPAPVAEEPAPAAEAAPVQETVPEVLTVKPERRKATQRKKRGGASEEPKQNVQKKQDKPAESRNKQPRVTPVQATEAETPAKPAETLSAQTRTELRAMLGDSVADDPELRFVMGCVEKYKTKLGLNNALVKRFGNQKASEIYQKLKPLLSAKKATDGAAKQKTAAKPKKEKEAVS